MMKLQVRNSKMRLFSESISDGGTTIGSCGIIYGIEEIEESTLVE